MRGSGNGDDLAFLMRQQAKLARSSEDKERARFEKCDLSIGGGGIMRHRWDFGAQCRYARDKIGVDQVLTCMSDIRDVSAAGNARQRRSQARSKQPAPLLSWLSSPGGARRRLAAKGGGIDAVCHNGALWL